MRLLFEPGEALVLHLRVTNRGAISSRVILAYFVTGAEGRSRMFGNSHTVIARPGRHWYALETIVPNVPSGPYEFDGTLYVPVPAQTSMTSDLYIAAGGLDAQDFSTPSANWPNLDDGDTACGPLSGEYRVLARLAGLDRLCMPGVAAAGVAVEVDARFEGSADGAAGLLLDYSAQDSFTAFMVSRDGRYALQRVQRGAGELLVPWTPSMWIRPGGQANHLAAVRDARQVTLFANGQRLATVPLGAVGPAQVGLYAQAWQAGLDARFDNWRVLRLP
jgi:hypothetical protein